MFMIEHVKLTSFAMYQARTKYDGWAALKGMSQEDAKRRYVDFANDKLSH
jgi:acyl-CoA-binding protein